MLHRSSGRDRAGARPAARRRLSGWGALLAALWLALPAVAGERITVMAAASLKNALDEIAAAHEAETGDRVALSYAGSSALARQILAGAPAGLFVSASPDWMDAVEAGHMLAPGTRADLLGNRMALVAPVASPVEPLTPGAETDLPALLGPDGRLAMALVEAVPAGIYGKAALQSLGLWEAVAPRVAQADNVRAALALVARGEAPLGIVYASDAVAEPRVKLLGLFPVHSHPRIVYPAAILTEGDTPAARALLARLRGAPARAIFARWGFVPPPG